MAFERGRMHKCTSPTGRLGATAKFNRDSASSAGASGCPKHDLRVGPPMLLPAFAQSAFRTSGPPAPPPAWLPQGTICAL